jgi:hypothetical protein
MRLIAVKRPSVGLAQLQVTVIAGIEKNADEKNQERRDVVTLVIDNDD